MSYTSRYQYLLKPVAWVSNTAHHSYGKLSVDDEEDSEKIGPPFQPKKQRQYLWAIGICLALSATSLIAGIAGMTYGMRQHNRLPRPSSKSVTSSSTEKECGTTPSEARLRGCQFEPMLSAWVPPACSFPEIVEEYQLAYGDIHEIWPWYTDYNLTHRVTGAEIDALQAGNYSVIYTTFPASHDLHCLYTWRKVSTALGKGVAVLDERSIQFYHNTHCAQHVTDMLYHPETLNDTWTFPLMYHNCVPLVQQ